MRNPGKTALGTHDIARVCHVSPPTAVRWIEEGKLPSFTTGGGHRRVWDADLVRFMREHNIPVPPELEAGGRTRILVIDDESTLRQVLRRVVAASFPDAEVHEAGDGFSAGRMVVELAPEVVVLDIQLPGLDGVSVCRAIRGDARLRSVRVLAISGWDVEETRERVLAAGADEFLGKPFGLRDVERALGRLLGRERGGGHG